MPKKKRKKKHGGKKRKVGPVHKPKRPPKKKKPFKKRVKKMPTKKLKKKKKVFKKKQKQAIKQKQKKKAKKYAKKKRIVKKELKRRKWQKTLNDIYNSDEWKLLTPEQQQLLTNIYESYDPEDFETSKLTPTELVQIANRVKKEVDPYYDELKQDITQDYEIELSDNIDQLKTERGRLEQDLQDALAENDSYAAEKIKGQISNLQETVGYMEQERDIYVTRKREYLQRRIDQVKSDLTTGLGRVSEDEARELRQLERQFTREMKDLREGMVNRGYAWSSERESEEQTLEEINTELVSATKTEATRRREDMSRAAEREVGAEALQGVQGAMLRGEEGELQIETRNAIDDLVRKYGMSIQEAIRTVEEKVGSQAVADAIGGQYAGQMVGGMEGDIKRAQRTTAEEARKQYGRTTEDITKEFARRYGTEGLAKAGIGGYTPPDIYGSTGAAGRAYTRQQRELEYDREGAKRRLQDLYVGAKQDAYIL